MICEHIKNLWWNSWPILSGHKSGHKIGQGPWNFNTWVQDRLTPMYQNFMDLVHELCPAQLLEVTKKSDNLSAWLTSIQHLAHIDRCAVHLVEYFNRCFATPCILYIPELWFNTYTTNNSTYEYCRYTALDRIHHLNIPNVYSRLF